MSKAAVYEFVARADSDPEVARALGTASGVPAIVQVGARNGLAFTAEELAPVLDLLRFLDDALRNAGLRSELSRADDPAAIVALGRKRGYAFTAEELAHLDFGPEAGALNERELDRVVGGSLAAPAGSTPIRLSTSVSTTRQTPNTSFGSMLATGLASALPTPPPIVPGGAVVGAAGGGTSTGGT
jgi:predicted ribosomally synthesized peptide with nif11-like leader